MSSYYSIQDQELLRTKCNIKAAVSIIFWCFAVWLFANEHDFVITFPFVLGAVVLAAQGFWLGACKDLAECKGYSGWYGLLALLNLPGMAILLFMPDRFLDREAPKMKVRRMSW